MSEPLTRREEESWRLWIDPDIARLFATIDAERARADRLEAQCADVAEAAEQYFAEVAWPNTQHANALREKLQAALSRWKEASHGRA